MKPTPCPEDDRVAQAGRTCRSVEQSLLRFRLLGARSDSDS